VREDDQHYPRTSLVCIENTHNTCGGRILTPNYVNSMAALCAELDLPLHMDGARVFNAAAGSGLPVEQLVAGADSVSICLSKGIGCPVGSVLVGSEQFIYRAKRARKMVGGGMRQVRA
jgi:threonine aldolase